MQLRSDFKDAFLEKHGVKLGFMSGFVKVRLSRCENAPKFYSKYCTSSGSRRRGFDQRRAIRKPNSRTSGDRVI
jgi:pyruvate/2-oxoglutarate dehydrogenase complex dihydrolipoamide acyltransferase (E2) component